MEIDDILDNVEVIKVGGQEVRLDKKLMYFDQDSLSNYLEKEAIWYAHYGSMLADAEAEYQLVDTKVDELYGSKFSEIKETQGGSDKITDSKVKQDIEYQEFVKKKIAAKRKVRLLQQYVKSWDRAHDNAQQRGHTIRKELDLVCHSSIYESKKSASDIVNDSELDDIIGKG